MANFQHNTLLEKYLTFSILDYYPVVPSVAEVNLTGVAPLVAVSHRFNIIFKPIEELNLKLPPT